MSTHFLVYSLLLGLALYPLVSNHSSNQRENALSVIGSLVMAFALLEQRNLPSIEDASISFAVLSALSFLLFASGYLNRAPADHTAKFNPIPALLLGTLATSFDALLLDRLESICLVGVQFLSLVLLTKRYSNPSTVNLKKAYGFGFFYSLVWLTHALSLDQDARSGMSPEVSEILANVLVGAAFVHMFWQDYSKTRARKLSQNTVIVEPEAVKLAYQARRVLKDVKHDLRQPLSTLGILASVGKAIARDTEVITRYEHIQTAQKALKTMIEQTFVQLDKSLQYPVVHLRHDFECFPIKDLLDPLIAEYRYLAANKGLEIRYIAPTLEICSSKEGLSKIIRNGLDNAIKYTRKGGVLVAVRRRGDKSAIQIIDTGPGVSTDKVSKHQKGWGHGSTIVMELSEQLSLQTTVKNRIVKGEVRGSVFEVLLNNKETDLQTPIPEKLSENPSKIIAEVLVNGTKNRQCLEENLPMGAFDEVRFGKLNLYRSYTTSIRKGAASVYVAYATNDDELEVAHQSLKTICRLLGGNPCCVVLYVDEEGRNGQIEFDENLIYLSVKKDSPNAFSAFGDFFPDAGRCKPQETTT